MMQENQDTGTIHEVVHSAQTAESSFRHYAAPLIEEAAGCAAALSDNADAEVLHELRVALRRLNTLLWAYQPTLDKAFYEEQRTLCRYLAHAAGDTRDWDVLMTVLSGLGMADSASHLRQTRDETFKISKATIANANLKNLLRHEVMEINKALNTAADRTPVEAFALTRLLAARAQLKQRMKAASHAKPDDYAALHAVRKSVKRVRYITELFEPLLGKAASKGVGKWKRLQERFGALNDIVASRDLLLKSSRLPLTGKEIQSALKLLKKEQERRRKRVEKLL